MDKKVLYALTAKIFNTLKGIGIKPKLGVTTDVKRLPGSRNSLNTDLSTLGETDPESLKRLIANDADFLPQATPDQIVQFNNNLEYLKSTYPETFAKQQVVTEAKTGIKTLVDDVNPKSKKLTKDEIADYEEQIGRDAEEWLSEGTIDEAEKALKNSKAEEAYYRGQYLTGKLDPVAGEKTQGRMDFLRKKAEYAEDVKDRRLITVDEINELDELERVFEPRSSSSINISDPKTAESFTNFAKQNDPEGFKKIQKIVDDINNKNTLEDFDVKDREPNAKGGLISGIGTMFRKRGR
jgi:hypothetical protein